MQHTFITIHPQIIAAYASMGIFLRAQKSSIAQFQAINLRDFATDSRGTVDDRPFGGGDGMVMRPDILLKARESVDIPSLVIYTSPKGQPWNQKTAEKYATEMKNIIFICGRFGGIDQRFINHYVDAEYSLGDVVYAGGELPSLMISESILRLIPGVLGNEESSRADSFSELLSGKIEHPLYTRPENFLGHQVPKVLVSGDHKAIALWREKHQILRLP